MMKNSNTFNIKRYKILIVSVFSFLLGCMITINLVPIDKTCRIEDTDREYNIMKNSKLKNPELIMLIMSAPKNLNKRNSARETWLKLQGMKENVKFKMKHYFVIGSLGLSADHVLHLSAEQSRYSDMLILPIYDGYKNLTYKVLKSFVWLNEQVDFGLGYKYVLKCDDDSFIRLDNLAHEITHIELLYLKSNIKNSDLFHDNTSPYIRVDVQINADSLEHNNLQVYWGYFHGNAKIKNSGKWRETNWILCDHYLPYALGGGYILSKGLVAVLAKNADYLRHYKSEDVSVGAWLSSINNILRIHDIRFDTEWTSRGCQNHNLISHNVSIKQMHTLYNRIIKKRSMCEYAAITRKHYLYDWSVLPSKCCSNKV